MQAGTVFTMGGADGPTAVYRTVVIARPMAIAVGLCAVPAVLSLWLFLKPRKKGTKP